MSIKETVIGQESILKFFIENSPDLLWVISSDFKQLYYLSTNFEKMFGLKRDEVANPQDWSNKLVYYKDKQKPEENIKKVMATHSSATCEYRIKLKNGAIRWVRDFAFPVELDNKILIAGFTKDITDIKLHEMRSSVRHNLSQILSAGDSLSESMPKILSAICSTFDWKIGMFWILEHRTADLHFFSSWFSPSDATDQLKAFEAKSRGIIFGSGDFFAGRAVLGEKAIYHKEILNAPEFSRALYAKQAGLHDGCVFPVKLKNETLGVLEFFNHEIEEMDGRTLEFFTDLGIFVGNFIEKQIAREQLKSHEALFHNAFIYSFVGIAISNIEGRFYQVNHSLCEMLGYSENEFLQKNYKNLIHPEDLAKNSNGLNQLVGGFIPSFQASIRVLSKSNNYLWVILSASLVKDANNLPLHIIFQLQDISYVQSYKEKLLQLAQYDAVTRLPNRQLLEHIMQQSLLLTSLSPKKSAIFVIDIDRFKLMNEPKSQLITDKLLLEIGQRLNSQIQVKDVIARLEGGEFALLVSDITNEQEIQAVLNQIFKVITTPFFVENQQFYVAASIGTSVFPDDATQPHELINKAYIAMTAAKRSGRNSSRFFSQEMLREEQEHLKIELNLREAIANNELTLLAQPIFDLNSGQVTAAELLLRWHSKTLGEVSTSKFVPIAERNGQIVDLGKWVLKNAALMAKKMQEEGLPPIILSINLSPRQIIVEHFLDYLINIFDELKLDHKQFRFEITETQLVENFSLISSFVLRLKEASFEFALDDFGVGYSSFSYLRYFAADRIKIDYSFIHNMLQEPKCAAITAAIVAMSQKLNIITIAEGVEKQEEIDYLKSINCGEVQGHFLSDPLTQPAFFEFLKKKI